MQSDEIRQFLETDQSQLIADCPHIHEYDQLIAAVFVDKKNGQDVTDYACADEETAERLRALQPHFSQCPQCLAELRRIRETKLATRPSGVDIGELAKDFIVGLPFVLLFGGRGAMGLGAGYFAQKWFRGK